MRISDWSSDVCSSDLHGCSRRHGKRMSAPAADKPEMAPKADKIGAYPRDYDTDALPERRSAALARMMTIVAVTEAFALVAMGFAIAALMPLQKVVQIGRAHV